MIDRHGGEMEQVPFGFVSAAEWRKTGCSPKFTVYMYGPFLDRHKLLFIVL